MGDLNTKVGVDNTAYGYNIVRNRWGGKKENCDGLTTACTFVKSVISTTIYPHYLMNKATRVTLNHNTLNQNGHIWMG